MVGKGGYAEVYKGVLEDGEAIAVKMLTKATDDERKEKEFLTEIGTLCHVCHPNVTSLVGCCIENGLYLIFQFSYKGSVASLLHGDFHLYYDCLNSFIYKKKNSWLLGLFNSFILWFLLKMRTCPQ